MNRFKRAIPETVGPGILGDFTNNRRTRPNYSACVGNLKLPVQRAQVNMKSATRFTLTPNNATALAQYAELAGLSPEEFLNKFLAEFLVARFADCECGDAEPFFLGLKFKDRPSAERVAAWIRKRVSGPPESRDRTEVEVFELARGRRFKIRAAWIASGRMYKICP
jgi:hypothetical protein